ncbi:hypothetical protein ScPMuIL_010039 [Solemya velum]
MWMRDIPDCVLSESTVINEFLDRYYPDPQLFPDDLWENAQVRMWQDWELSFDDVFSPIVAYNMVGFMQRLLVGSKGKLEALMGPDTPDTVREKNLKIFDATLHSREEVTKHVISVYKMLIVLEKALEGKDYVVGEKLTAADITVYSRMHMFIATMLPIPAEKFPNCARYREALAKRKTFEYGDSRAAAFSRMFRCMPGLIVSVSNWRSGQQHQMLDGGSVIDRAIAENEEETSDGNEFAKLLPGVREDEIVVFDYPTSTQCWRTKLLLAETALRYREVDCDVLDLIGRPGGSGGRFRLQHGEKLLTGENSILEYINKLAGPKGFVPADPYMRARVQCWLAWDHGMYIGEMAEVVELKIVSKILLKRFKKNIDGLLSLRSNARYSDKFQNIVACYINGAGIDGNDAKELKDEYGHLGMSAEEKEKLVSHCKLCLVKRLEYLDGLLQDQKYLVGDEITLADLAVWCRLQLFEHIGVDISSKIYPNLYKWLIVLKARQQFWRLSEKMERFYRSC